VTDPKKPPPTELAPPALTSLLSSLNEVQQTIRAYGTKAQIMGVGFIFSITMVGKLLENLPVAQQYDLGYLIGGFLLLIGPVALFGTVLYPSRRSAPKTETDGSKVRRLFLFRKRWRAGFPVLCRRYRQGGLEGRAGL
jgi:hypothetical protein